ncbi:UNVERIFIED_CONTAM: hypothetical protein Scaly_1059000 [Sesamum calycinum]|uniref:Zinc finger BED domain-containing protein RICESLEEPER 2-like n=1 Tax=Sesamum calycinum TaxID=2727403 RepID=A0AAW2QL38_9LAMI
MVITGHWIDESWQLQKRMLNFVHIPPLRRGLEIANAIWRCLEDWGIESKIHIISVDNASANDSAIENLKIYLRNKRRLLCEGRLFHVRCCAHILNLIAQDGLFEIKQIVDVIRDSVEYVRRSDARLEIFSEIVKQLNLSEKKLVDDCRTRWNSTYEMLAAAIKFKDVLPRFADRELHYDICPSAEDWTKAKKVCSVLELFWTATHIVSEVITLLQTCFLMRFETIATRTTLQFAMWTSETFALARARARQLVVSEITRVRARQLDLYKLVELELPDT